MTAGLDMAAVTALVGDPGRANMLAAMLDGRAHTATELAHIAGVSPPTASGHLAGALGTALLERALAAGMVRRREGSRALDVRADLDSILGILATDDGR